MADLGVSRDTVVKAVTDLVKLDMADLEDYLDGQCSLKELRARGVPTHLLSKVEVRVSQSSGGSKHVNRVVQVTDKAKALAALARVLGVDQIRPISLHLTQVNAAAEAPVRGDAVQAFKDRLEAMMKLSPTQMMAGDARRVEP